MPGIDNAWPPPPAAPPGPTQPWHGEGALQAGTAQWQLTLASQAFPCSQSCRWKAREREPRPHPCPCPRPCPLPGPAQPAARLRGGWAFQHKGLGGPRPPRRM